MGYKADDRELMRSVRNGRNQLSGSGKSGYERREEKIVASGPGSSVKSVLIAIVIGVFGEC